MSSFALFSLALAYAGGSALMAQPIEEITPAQTDAEDEDDSKNKAAVAVPYEPMSTRQRFVWATKLAVSPQRLAGYTVTSALATWRNSPREYGTHWDGYGKRIALRMSIGATGVMVETAVGSLWGEDPRYVPASGQPMKARIFNVIKMTALARNREGKVVPAYARYISVPASNFLTNTWRAESHASVQQASYRIPISLGID